MIPENIDEIKADVNKLLRSCDELSKEIKFQKEKIEFLINEWKTNKRYFTEDDDHEVTVEDVIKTVYFFAWSARGNFDYTKKRYNKERKMIGDLSGPLPENKRLLITDLCARLPYNTIVSVAEGGINGVQWNKSTLNFYLLHQIEEEDGWEFIKPYLRPMSSMTKEEKEEYHNLSFEEDREEIEFGELVTNIYYHDTIESIDWLNSHHFDYRGLIEKGLAIEALEEMYLH